MTTIQQAVHIFKKDVRFLRIEIAVLAVVCAIFAWLAFRLHTSFEIPNTVAVDVLSYTPSYGSTNSDHASGISRRNFTDRSRDSGRPRSGNTGILVYETLSLEECASGQSVVHRHLREFAQFCWLGSAIISPGWILASAKPVGIDRDSVLDGDPNLIPAAALAAVTANLVSFTFTALALLAAEILLPVLFRTSLALFFRPMRSLAVDLFLFAMGILVVYIQYRYRKTALSRVLGVVILAFGLVIYLWVPMSFAMDVQSRIWNGADASLAQVVISAPAEKFLAEKGTISITLELPVEVKGLPKDLAVIPKAFQVRINGFANRTIHSDSINGDWFPGSPLLASWNPRIEVPTSVLMSERGKTLTLHASAFLSLFKRVRTVSVLYEPNQWLDIPGGTRCFDGYFLHCERTSTFRSQLITYTTGDRDIVWSIPPRAPFSSIEALNPVVTTSQSLRSKLDSELTVWEHVADLKRDVEIQNFPLTDYVDVLK
jgi:hypothetical protein